MSKKSAGLLLYRITKENIEVFLVHPGGPFWAKKDYGSWSIPKGEFEEEEDPFEAAKREFLEETGFNIVGEFQPLNSIKQPSGKLIYTWAIKGNVEAKNIKSNIFSIEWPKDSGKFQQYPEIDKADWFTIDNARQKILKGQVGFLDQLDILIKRIPSDISTREVNNRKPPIQGTLFDVNNTR